MPDPDHLLEVLRRFRTIVGIVVDQAEIDPVETVVAVRAIGPDSDRTVLKMSLADCFAEVDELLIT